MDTLEFRWHDGGRAASGFVGTTGDCVTRAIAIAANKAYRDVYQDIGDRSLKSPRDGVPVAIAAEYLRTLGWDATSTQYGSFHHTELPNGALVLNCVDESGKSCHFCAVIDRVVHDTWNPFVDDRYFIKGFWKNPIAGSPSTSHADGAVNLAFSQDALTQEAFERILKRLRALDRTANNDASTEGEKRNALRMMQTLMLKNNLTRKDLGTDGESGENLSFSQKACPLNGRRSCVWELLLANYICKDVFGTIQWYSGSKGHRRLYYFYGPVADVENGVELFQELLATIATAAHLKYGSHARGSGASYAEGYVQGLPRASSETTGENAIGSSELMVIEDRMLMIRDAGSEWLERECGIRLVRSNRRGRYSNDPSAQRQGRIDGAEQPVHVRDRPKRIGHRPAADA